MDIGSVCILIPFVHDSELEEAIHMLGGRVAIQKDNDKLKGWADPEANEVQKKKYGVMHLGCIKVVMHQ